VEAELPARPIDKGIPGPGLLAQVVTSKYADHLPLYRQETIFTRSGIHIARQTQCEWVGAVAGLMEPIVGEMRREVLGSRVIHCDDTSVTVQDRYHPGGSRNGYVWVYVGEQGDLVFDYTDSRSRDGPLAFLEGYRGYLQADAYAGYDEVFRRGDVTEVGCWAHARRRVYEAVKTALEPATLLLALIRRLYRVEREAREAKMDAAERLVLRQEKSRPILGLIEEQLESLSPRCLPKSPLGEAIGYAQRQWQALMRYTEDGILAIDNNVAYAARGINQGMPTPGLCRHGELGSRSTDMRATCSRHNQRPSRKASRRSGGRYRSGTTPDGLAWASARSLSCISACK
jgi:hypothetical protein